MAAKDLFSGFEPYKLTNVQLTGKKLGHGSYATVVELKYMGLKCAGKIIHDVLLEQGDDSYTIRRFEEECRILSRVRHPNIVQFLGVYFKEKERVPMLVMEFLPMNLTACIEKHGILPEERSYSILHDVALGLCYLHNQSPPIIHRDLSSNNVLLTENMNAKISDLGVAKIHNLTPLQVTRMTQTPGTPAYMPPEVMVAKPKYDTSIDTFSFGILTIHIHSGQWPEPQCSQIRMEGGVMIPVSEAERRQSFLEVIGTDHKLMNLILKCIHNDPKERMSATDIVEKMTKMVSKSFKQLIADQVEGDEEKTTEDSVPRKLQPDEDKSTTTKEEDSLQELADGTDSEIKTSQVDSLAQKRIATMGEKQKVQIKQISTTEECLPKVELEEWYFGSIERAIAVQKLKENGEFLVRYSITKQQYIISCRWKNECQHYLVEKNSFGEYFLESDVFQSMKGLIDFYITKGKQIGTAKVIIQTPVSKHDKWEVKSADVEITRKTGISTKFGEILEGLDKRTNQKIMLKSYRGNIQESINSFLLEAEVLKQCNHSNVVQLIGVCTEPNQHALNNPMYIVTEYTSGGTFLQFLKEKGESEKKSKLCRMSIDVCEGLNYIHTKLVRAHCNITAKSCLVGEYDIVKVSNLGYSMCFKETPESGYQEIFGKTQVRLKWTGPEFIHRRRHLLSDIWSFGVLMWETFSGGQDPYPGMDSFVTLSKIEDGYRMPPPVGCPQEIKSIMLECWNYNPKCRPSFAQLLGELKTVYSSLTAQGI